MNMKGNQKYQATHQAIISALMDALKVKSIKQVTVAEICRAVRINRSTFYEHFGDVYDILEQIADDISAEALKNVPDNQPTREDFLYLLNHIRDNKEFYILFFHQNLPLNIYAKFFFGKTPPSPPQAVLDARGIKSKVQLEYHHAFFQAGLEAILKKWLERGCAESTEEIYDLLQTEYRELPIK